MHIAHHLVLFSDYTPTHSLMQFPVHSICIKLLYWNCSNVPVAVPWQPQQPHSLYTDCELWSYEERNPTIEHLYLLTYGNALAQIKAHTKMCIKRLMDSFRLCILGLLELTLYHNVQTGMCKMETCIWVNFHEIKCLALCLLHRHLPLNVVSGSDTMPHNCTVIWKQSL